MRGLASTGIGVVPDRRPRAARALEPGQAEPRPSTSRRPTASTSSTSWPPRRDVFLTNKLPSVRDKLHIDVDDIRAHNPNIIYVRGTGQGERGPDADKGSYDALAFWARSGVAVGRQAPRVRPRARAAGARLRRLDRRHDDRRRDHGRAVPPRAHRRGHHRRRLAARHRAVGHGPGRRPCRSCSTCRGRRRPPTQLGVEPAVAQLRDQGRALARRSPACRPASTGRRSARSIGRPELATDPRFADHASLHGQQPRGRRAARPRSSPARPLDEWRERLDAFSGQWAVVQDTLEAADDPQTVANGYVQDCETAGGTPFQLVAAPVQFDEEPATPGRAPEFNEHGDEILASSASTGTPSSTSRSAASSPDRRHHLDHQHHQHIRRTRHDAVRRIPLRRQAGPRRRRRHRHGCRGRRAAAGRRRRGRGHGLRRGHPRRAPRPSTSTWPRRTRSTPPSTRSAARSTRCSPVPASPTARPASRRSTSSATAT